MKKMISEEKWLEFRNKLILLKEKEVQDHKIIVKDVLAINLFFIYWKFYKLLEKNEIKSPTIFNYIKSSRSFFDEHLNLINNDQNSIKSLERDEYEKFKKDFNKESDDVKKLVVELNNIFTIKHDNYSWKTFNKYYQVEEEINALNRSKFKKLNHKMDRIISKLNKQENNFDEKQKLKISFFENEFSSVIKQSNNILKVPYKRNLLWAWV